MLWYRKEKNSFWRRRQKDHCDRLKEGFLLVAFFLLAGKGLRISFQFVIFLHLYFRGVQRPSRKKGGKNQSHTSFFSWSCAKNRVNQKSGAKEKENKNKLCSMTCGGDSQEEQKMNMIYSWWLICKVSLLYDFRMGCDPPWYEEGGGSHPILKS